MQRKCEHCGVEFDARPTDVKKGFGRFCSKRCGWESHRKPGGKANARRAFNKRDGRWYRQWREPETGRHVHKMLENRWVWEQAHGPIPEGHDIHHKDHDPTNNSLDNLECKPRGEHNAYHQRLREDHRIIDGVEHRRCQRCREYKPLDCFSLRRAGTYHGYCQSCLSDYVREWRYRNADKRREHRRRYREKVKARKQQ